MKFKIVVLSIIALLPIIACGQSLSDVNIKRERTFTGKGLYGFMNGGADLYLEYGVLSLTTRDVEYKGEEYTIDIYEMPSATDAFGIYSLNVFKCQRVDSLGSFDCLSPYLLQLAAGNKYISAVFQSGSNATKSAVDELIKLYIDIDSCEKLVIPAPLNLSHPDSGTLKYMRGALSTSHVESSLVPIIDKISFSGIWLVTDKLTKEEKALIELRDKNDLSLLKERIEAADIIQCNDTSIYIKVRKKIIQEKDLGPFGF